MREAARRVGITQPALSKSIRLLEEELQTELFTRSSRGAVLTSKGRIFAVRARAINAELRKVHEELAHPFGGVAPSITVGVGQSSAITIVPQALQEFRKEWPQAIVRFIEGLPETLVPLIRDGTIDFALGGVPDNLDKGISFKPLFRSRRVVAVRKEHPLRNAQSLCELDGTEWIRTPPIEAVGGPLEDVFTSNGLAPPTALVRCDSYHTAAALLASSDMLALMSERQLETPFCSQLLQAINVREPIPSFTVGMFARTDVPLAPAAEVFSGVVTRVARHLASTANG